MRLARCLSAQAVLFRLRVQLYAAQMRSAAGRVQALTGLLVLTALNTFLAKEGFRTGALVSLQSPESGGVVLGALMMNGVAGTLVLGQRTRARFGEAALRRYPLSRADRFAARNLLGLLDPLWVLLTVVGVSYATGVAAARGSSVARNTACMLLYLLTAYLLAAVVIGGAQRLVGMLSSGGRVLGVLSTLAAVLVGGLWAWLGLSGPPGALAGSAYAPWEAARRVLFDDGSAAVGSAVLLTWSTVLGLVVYLIERRAFTPPPGSFGVSAGPGSFAWLAEVGPARFGPLMAQASVYYSRGPRALPGLVALPLVAGFSERILGAPGATVDTAFPTVMLFFVCGFASTANVAVNQLGYAGPGVWRFFTLPVPLADVVRAGGLVSLLIGSLVTLAALLIRALVIGADLAGLALLACSAAAGVTYCGALSMWTTLLVPKRASLWNLMDPPSSGTALAAMLVCGALPLVAAAALLGRAPSGSLALPLALLPVLIFGVVAYVATWRAVRAVPARWRERAATAIGGAVSEAKE